MMTLIQPLFGLTARFYNYHEFSFDVSFSKILERFGNLIQLIPSINDRDDFAGFTKPCYMNQIFEIWSNRQDPYPLPRGSSNPRSHEQNLKKSDHRTSDSEITSIRL